MKLFCTVILMILLGLASQAYAGETVIKLAQLSFEELMNIKVTTVTKVPLAVADSPAAVYVITAEDIRRAGVETLPDALRLAPGVQVAAFSSGIVGVSIRGFNKLHSNKLLVMIDGRSIYNHIFSGVFWDEQNLMIEDIDRIEVIRGPGSTLWGANAVDGVINVITKQSADTEGVMLTVTRGSEDYSRAAARFGGSIGDDFSYRLSVNGFDRSDDTKQGSGATLTDDWKATRINGRADWQLSDADSLGFQFADYRTDIDRMNWPPGAPQASKQPQDVSGWYLTNNWIHRFSDTSESKLSLYYDTMETKHQFDFSTMDADLQHYFNLTDRQMLVWGGGYRHHDDRIGRALAGDPVFDPHRRHLDLYSLFLQDTVQLVPDVLSLTLGTKYEHNDFTGSEWQPNVRLLWMPDKKQSLWAAVTRAVRTPSRLDVDATVATTMPPPPGAPPGAPPGHTTVYGSTGFGSESLVAYELGYRVKPCTNVNLDLAMFYNDYDDLAAYEQVSPDSFRISNRMRGETHGLEVVADWRVTDRWRLEASYSWLRSHFEIEGGMPPVIDQTDYLEHTTPRHQGVVRSYWTLGDNVEVSLFARYVDKIRFLEKSANVLPPPDSVAAYLTFDATLTWQMTDHLQLSLIGRNLGNPHREALFDEVSSSGYAKLTWTY